jgi:hypothetical protein
MQIGLHGAALGVALGVALGARGDRTPGAAARSRGWPARGVRGGVKPVAVYLASRRR